MALTETRADELRDRYSLERTHEAAHERIAEEIDAEREELGAFVDHLVARFEAITVKATEGRFEHLRVTDTDDFRETLRDHLMETILPPEEYQT